MLVQSVFVEVDVRVEVDEVKVDVGVEVDEVDLRRKVDEVEVDEVEIHEVQVDVRLKVVVDGRLVVDVEVEEPPNESLL